MTHNHRYSLSVHWSATAESRTSGYDAYSRDHRLSIPGKPDIALSSDPTFRGDASRHNPEELLLASLSSCHLLWYLHLAAVNGVLVLDYRDEASGVMAMESDGGGRFIEATLKPVVLIAAGSDAALALRLHEDAAAKCFIARSVNFPVHHQPRIVTAQ